MKSLKMGWGEGGGAKEMGWKGREGMGGGGGGGEIIYSLKPVLNWTNCLFAEHTSDSWTNCNSFLN